MNVFNSNYKLVGFKRLHADGSEIIEQYFKGYLFYKKEGNVVSCGVQVFDDNENLVTQSFYLGNFEVIDESHVTHIPLVSTELDRVGKKLKREYKIVDGQLVIRGQGLSSLVGVTWEKI